MAYDGLMNDVRKAIALKKPSQVPVFAISEEFDVKWHGKYTYEQVCQDGAKMAEVWIAAIEEFDYDWAWLQIDDCFEFEPLGVGCYGRDNIVRATKDYLPATRETLEGLQIPQPANAGRMPEKLKAIRKIRERFGDSVCVVGSCSAPYSSVGFLYGLEETMMLMFTDPELLADTCDFFVELQTKWCLAQIEAGAHSIWLGDCCAFSGLISVEQYHQWAFEPCKKLTKRIIEAGGLVHLHNSEISVPYILAEAELGVSIISIGPAANIADVHSVLTDKQCFSGNLDPIEVLMRGTPEQVASETRRIMNLCKDSGGYLSCTGEMNPRDVPVDNMRAYMKTARECSYY